MTYRQPQLSGSHSPGQHQLPVPHKALWQDRPPQLVQVEYCGHSQLTQESQLSSPHTSPEHCFVSGQ